MKKLLLLFFAAVICMGIAGCQEQESVSEPTATPVEENKTGHIYNNNIPHIVLPGITQADFEDAFLVLEENCYVPSEAEPINGFIYPFCAPGGYGMDWWQSDTSLSLSGIKWSNQELAENVLRNFMRVQKEDGRIPLNGGESFEGCSSIPKLFQTAYDVLKRTNDEQLIQDTYQLLKKDLDWWLKERWDNRSKLVKGFAEEYSPGGDWAVAVDTNVEVIGGCYIVAELAQYYNDPETAQYYLEKAEKIKNRLNTYLWNSEQNCFMNRDWIKQSFAGSAYTAAAFDPFQFNIADPKYHATMLAALTDENMFQWDTIPLTSAAKTDPKYNETPGVYSVVQWFGSIWTARNLPVIQGLRDIGRYDLAAHLALKTVENFNGNYAEFLHPPTGSGEGVARYSWTASQYIQIIIEHIFGVEFNYFTNTLSITPNLDASLQGQTIECRELMLPHGGTLDLKITYNEKDIQIEYNAENISDIQVVVSLPSNNRIVQAKDRTYHNVESGYGQLCRVENGATYKDKIIFTW